ncbi:MAG: nucleoside phosphorylase [Anaerolineae bacterium]|nr:nucleoside phosphorylase [Anaerolineae bacterium]
MLQVSTSHCVPIAATKALRRIGTPDALAAIHEIKSEKSVSLNDNYPILEFDPTREALIEPGRLIRPVEGIPEGCVLCFFREVIDKLRDDGRLTLLWNGQSEIGIHPAYRIEVDGRCLVVTHPGVGAPLAAALLEETIARGCRKFIACGGAGVLQSEIAQGHVIVPTSAVRDEGTSYHYLPPGREVLANVTGVTAIERVLRAHEIPYMTGKTWTTDAFYRETPAKIRQRKEEDCITVEMEAAAFFAVAQFRNVIFGQILYGGDDVGGTKWDSREWHRDASTREKLFWLAAEACLSMD